MSTDNKKIDGINYKGMKLLEGDNLWYVNAKFKNLNINCWKTPYNSWV